MFQFTNSLNSWGTTDFTSALKAELESLDADALQLQRGLSHSSYVAGDDFEVMIISVCEAGGVIRARVGVFYSGVISGCSCDNDPTPNGKYSEYCELQVDIDRTTAAARVALLPETAGT